MGYKTQKEAWLRGHPKATAAEAWEAGYVQCTENWCRKERFGKFDSNVIKMRMNGQIYMKTSINSRQIIVTGYEVKFD